MTSYSTGTAILILQHQFPRDSSTRALVDIRLLLEAVKSDHTRVGEWIHVIGYVAAAPSEALDELSNQGVSDVHVQALSLWPAGPFNLDDYQVSLLNSVT